MRREAAVTPCDHLIQEAGRVSHAARGLASNHSQGFVLGFDTFLRQHVAQAADDEGGGNELEVEALDSAQNGYRYFVNFSRRKDELYVWWRFFERLQERIPCALRQHVNLVHDDDLVPIPGGAIR